MNEPAADQARGAAADGAQSRIALAAREAAPVVWLLGKVQSGKSSIVRALTGSSDAEIGLGYEACTRDARVYPFPPEAPILRFLDTRGLEEAGYAPAADMAYAESCAHLLLVTMRAMDMAQEAVIEALAAVRGRHPEWPLVVVQTCLHEAYEPGRGHVVPYPEALRTLTPTAALPADLLRALSHQRRLFTNLRGPPPVFVAVDFTRAEDGFAPADYGLEELVEALLAAAPASMRDNLLALAVASADPRRRQAASLVMGYAVAAAGTDAVPLAGVIGVPVIQSRLIQRLGQIYEAEWDKRAYAEFAAALGTGVALRAALGFGARQLAKLVPVYGQTVAAATAAASSFAVTYALGHAAIHFLSRRRHHLDVSGTASAYQTALREAFGMRADRADKTS